jgi:hypothetical protein
MFERRQFYRTPVNKAAKVIFQASCPMLNCTVVDLSIGGACLQFETDYPMPEEFDLTFDAGVTRRACVKRWESTSRVGVAFQLARNLRSVERRAISPSVGKQ